MLFTLWNRGRQQRWTRHPLTLISVIILLVGAGLAAFSKEVLRGETLDFDQYILGLFRQTGDPALAIGPAWVKLAMVELTALGGHSVLILFTLLAAGLCLAVRRYGSLFFLLLAAAGAIGLNTALKLIFARARPDVVEPLVQVYTYSYPSGHALLSATFYLSFAFLLAEMARSRLTRIYIISCGFLLAGLIGFTRVYLGVHYPTDILAGWAIGTAWALVCWILLRHLRRPIEPSAA